MHECVMRVVCVCRMSQREQKGSQTDETREAAAHSTKALYPWKIALHLLDVCLTVCVH